MDFSLSFTEENYLKAIFHLSYLREESISTSAIAEQMQTAAASVTDMLKRLSDKHLLDYEKYRGVRLSPNGERIARQLVRRHRLWETFMVEKLGFSWDEVHPIAEELEHIRSEELVNRLEVFLGYPKFDPHGDPIPDRQGNILRAEQGPLNELVIGGCGLVVGVADHSADFLRYLEALNLRLGAYVALRARQDYDNSLQIELAGGEVLWISERVAQNVLIKLSNA